MKRLLLIGMPLLAAVITLSFIVAKPAADSGEVKWMTWAQMQEAQKVQPRKVYVDVYTDWCGWCKRMDQTTFKHPELVKFLNENFYSVKFDAETHETITFKGKEYKYVAQGYRGYNELAAEILSGQLSYPTSVYLDEEMKLIFPVPGYQDPKTFEQVINFIHSNNHKSGMTFDQFTAQFKGKVQ